MVVKVVGNDPNIVKRATCNNCGSILEYVPADLEKRVERDYGGGADTVYYIKCPSCRKDVVGKRW